LSDTDRETAAQVINRVRLELARAMEESGWQVTFSIGIATFLPTLGSVAEMIKSADKAMYAAKRMGKNRIKYDHMTSVQSALLSGNPAQHRS
jgi:diguanylate cyclase (GGDEF)-like protein